MTLFRFSHISIRNGTQSTCFDPYHARLFIRSYSISNWVKAFTVIFQAAIIQLHSR